MLRSFTCNVITHTIGLKSTILLLFLFVFGVLFSFYYLVFRLNILYDFILLFSLLSCSVCEFLLFSSHMGYIFLLLSPDNFLLDIRHFELFLVEGWIFLCFCKYTWVLYIVNVTRNRFSLGLIFLTSEAKPFLSMVPDAPWIMRFFSLIVESRNFSGSIWTLGIIFSKTFRWIFPPVLDGLMKCMGLSVVLSWRHKGDPLYISRVALCVAFFFLVLCPANCSCLDLPELPSPPGFPLPALWPGNSRQ